MTGFSSAVGRTLMTTDVVRIEIAMAMNTTAMLPTRRDDRFAGRSGALSGESSRSGSAASGSMS
jgi:hypothetical protein